MAFSPKTLNIWVNGREIHAFIQTAAYPSFKKGGVPALKGCPFGPLVPTLFP